MYWFSFLFSTFIWWQQYKQDDLFMQNLLLHQPLNMDDVQRIMLWKSNEVTIYYVMGCIFVSRTDIKDGMEISYKFDDDAPKYEGYTILKSYFDCH